MVFERGGAATGRQRILHHRLLELAARELRTVDRQRHLPSAEPQPGQRRNDPRCHDERHAVGGLCAVAAELQAHLARQHAAGEHPPRRGERRQSRFHHALQGRGLLRPGLQVCRPALLLRRRALSGQIHDHQRGRSAGPYAQGGDHPAGLRGFRPCGRGAARKLDGNPARHARCGTGHEGPLRPLHG